MLLGCGKDENHIARRLLKCLQEGVESSRRQHVYLVDDEYAVTCVDRRHLHLVDEVAHVVNAIVGCGIELDNVKRASFVELAARCTFVTCLTLGGAVLAVDCLGKYSGARGLSHSA